MMFITNCYRYMFNLTSFCYFPKQILLFGPASTKEASNKSVKNRDRRLKFNSDKIENC